MAPGSNRGPQAGTWRPANGWNDNTSTVRRLGPPCGCPMHGPHACAPSRSSSASARHLEAARAAWHHLALCGLLDSEGFVEDVLRRVGRAS